MLGSGDKVGVAVAFKDGGVSELRSACVSVGMVEGMIVAVLVSEGVGVLVSMLGVSVGVVADALAL